MLDTDLLTLGAFFGAWLFFFILGAEVKSYYGIISGVAGLFLALELFTLTGNPVAGILWIAVSIFTLLIATTGAMQENESG